MEDAAAWPVNTELVLSYQYIRTSRPRVCADHRVRPHLPAATWPWRARRPEHARNGRSAKGVPAAPRTRGAGCRSTRPPARGWRARGCDCHPGPRTAAGGDRARGAAGRLTWWYDDWLQSVTSCGRRSMRSWATSNCCSTVGRAVRGAGAHVRRRHPGGEPPLLGSCSRCCCWSARSRRRPWPAARSAGATPAGGR